MNRLSTKTSCSWYYRSNMRERNSLTGCGGCLWGDLPALQLQTHSLDHCQREERPHHPRKEHLSGVHQGDEDGPPQQDAAVLGIAASLLDVQPGSVGPNQHQMHHEDLPQSDHHTEVGHGTQPSLHFEEWAREGRQAREVE